MPKPTYGPISQNGGRRAGAGRKPGVPNKVTEAERVKALEAAEKTPLEILVELANWHYGRWKSAVMGEDAEVSEPIDDGAEGNPPSADDRERDLMAKARAAGDAADKAAPYLHPKFAAIQHTGKDGGPIEVRTLADFYGGTVNDPKK